MIRLSPRGRAPFALVPLFAAAAVTAVSALLLAPGASAQEPPPALAAVGDLERLEDATNDLIRAKRNGAERIARLGDDATAALRPCRRSGPGWKRIRRIGDASQRGLYRVAARRLHDDMLTLTAEQQPRIEVWDGAFQRYVERLRASGVTHAPLAEAIAVQGRRLASYHELAELRVGCRAFNRLTRRIRELPTRTPRQIIRADYASGPRARRIERWLSKRVRRIERRAGIRDRDVDVLADAADVIVRSGGTSGWAAGFQYGLSLR